MSNGIFIVDKLSYIIFVVSIVIYACVTNKNIDRLMSMIIDLQKENDKIKIELEKLRRR